MTERERFEAWAGNLELDLTRVDSGCADGEVYSDCNTDYAWMAWQSASAAPASPNAVLVAGVGGGAQNIGNSAATRASAGPYPVTETLVDSAAPAQEPVAPDGWRDFLQECRDFWAHYSCVNESAQNDMDDERGEMLDRMDALLYAAPVASAAPVVPEQFDELISWLLGEEDDFPEHPATLQVKGRGLYWWRTELRKRYDALKSTRPRAKKGAS